MVTNYGDEKDRDLNLSLNSSYLKDKKEHNKNYNNNNCSNLTKENYQHPKVFNDSSKIIEEENDYSAKKINYFCFNEKKEIERELILNNNNESQNFQKSNLLKNLKSIGNLNNNFLNAKNNGKLLEMRKTIEEINKNKIEIEKIQNLISRRKENVKEIADDRNQLIADKINLENSFDCLAIKYNKMQEKSKEYFTVKEKNSQNLNINYVSFSSILSFGKQNCNIVNTEKNLDELIYELENKLAYVKIENGMLYEKIDSVDEVLQTNDFKNKVNSI